LPATKISQVRSSVLTHRADACRAARTPGSHRAATPERRASLLTHPEARACIRGQPPHQARTP